ncbi:MAG TPA: DUF222 domain-containing protein [Acidimicrobiia bacterium]|nr:DUF222 domain-containing protein [Acidimicrobiia bacterium]
MFDGVRRAVVGMRGCVAGLDPAALSPADAVVLVGLMAELERLAGAGRALAAGRAAESGVWEREGFRSPAHWLASRSGTSVGAAVSTLEMARRLDEQPVVDAAVRAGTLSLAQATEISSVAGAAPEVAGVLVEVAQREPLRRLQHHCRNARAAHDPVGEDARYRRVHESRYVRWWTERDGAFRLDARLTADAGAAAAAVIERERDTVFSEARRAGRREGFDAYTADAFVRVVTGTGTSRAAPAQVRVSIDHAALQRGHVKDGERCEIVGVGPVPVSVVERLASDAVLKVLVTDGTDVRAVAHAGRTIPARVRSALEERDPSCVVPGCLVRDRLEIHHLVPYARGGPTTLDNLVRVCAWHHHALTHDHCALERNETGCWTWRAPP